ncbi:hypothetical protein Esti_002203 [Eimeria stiedai]
MEHKKNAAFAQRPYGFRPRTLSKPSHQWRATRGHTAVDGQMISERKSDSEDPSRAQHILVPECTFRQKTNKLDTISADLAFVEERLVRAMADPHLDTSLGPTLDRLRELREMVAAIQAKHAEVTFAWTKAAAAARALAQTSVFEPDYAAAETTKCWPDSHEPVQAEGAEPAQFSFSGLKSLLPFLSDGGDSSRAQPLTARGTPSGRKDPGAGSEVKHVNHTAATNLLSHDTPKPEYSEKAGQSAVGNSLFIRLPLPLMYKKFTVANHQRPNIPYADT